MPLTVADDVGVFVAEADAVILSEFELLAGVFEGLDPIERVAEDENEIDALRVMVDEAVCEDVAVPEIVALDVGVTDGVLTALIVDDGDIGGETVALNEIEEVPLAELQKERVLVGVNVIVEDTLATIDSLSLPVLVPDDVTLEVLEPVPDEELVGLFDGEEDGVAVDESEADGDIVALNDKDGVLLAVPPTDKEFGGVAVTVLEKLTVVDPLSLPLGV